MNEKKTTIIEASMELFSEKGFFKTSVQDIAHRCKMSKASIYKFFESKEEILIQMIKLQRDHMIMRAEAVADNDDSTVQEKFKIKILQVLREFSSKKKYFLMLNQSYVNNDTNKVQELLNQTWIILLNWYKDCIIDAYGKKVEPIAWDLALSLQAMINQVMFLMECHKKDLTYEDAVTFITRNVHAIVLERNEESLLLSNEKMEPFDLKGEYRVENLSPETIPDALFSLKREVKNHIPSTKQQDVLSAVDIIEEEYAKKDPRLILIHALVNYLAEYKEIEHDVYLIKRLLDETH